MMDALLVQLGLEQLTAEQRLQLVGELWDSLTEQPESVRLTDSQQAELQRRLERHRDNPLAGTSWHEFRARVTEHRE